MLWKTEKTLVQILRKQVVWSSVASQQFGTYQMWTRTCREQPYHEREKTYEPQITTNSKRVRKTKVLLLWHRNRNNAVLTMLCRQLCSFWLLELCTDTSKVTTTDFVLFWLTCGIFSVSSNNDGSTYILYCTYSSSVSLLIDQYCLYNHVQCLQSTVRYYTSASEWQVQSVPVHTVPAGCL